MEQFKGRQMDVEAWKNKKKRRLFLSRVRVGFFAEPIMPARTRRKKSRHERTRKKSRKIITLFVLNTNNKI